MLRVLIVGNTPWCGKHIFSRILSEFGGHKKTRARDVSGPSFVKQPAIAELTAAGRQVFRGDSAAAIPFHATSGISAAQGQGLVLDQRIGAGAEGGGDDVASHCDLTHVVASDACGCGDSGG